MITNIVKCLTRSDRFSLRSFFSLVSGCVGMLFLFYMSRVYWKVNWYSDPDFSLGYLLRSVIIAGSSFLIILSFQSKSAGNPTKFCLINRPWIWTGYIISMLSFLIFFIIPDYARIIGEEDGIIEWASFFVLVACMVLLFRVLISTRALSGLGPVAILSVILFGFLIFFMLMEEISWGQRILGLTSPAIFESNSQQEINIHNFITTEADTAYYTGLCFLFVFLPYFKMNHPDLFSGKFWELFVPGPHLIILGALPFAFHFNKWNLLFTQIWFFSSLAVLLTSGLGKRTGNGRHHFLLTALLLMIIQVGILCFKDSIPVVESGRIAEYKELLSQIGLLVYTTDIHNSLLKRNKNK